jgi:hypothetical protein
MSERMLVIGVVVYWLVVGAAVLYPYLVLGWR